VVSLRGVTNIAIILLLLLLPYFALVPLRLSRSVRARVGVALVFAFTGSGHFIKTNEMVAMLPSWVPQRELLVHATGVFELLASIGILIPTLARTTGLALCLFLILVLPSNVYAALQRVDFGGHDAGPIYLLVRVPLQCILIVWIYWFAVRKRPHGSS
jgi:uncharacterized membrane protein